MSVSLRRSSALSNLKSGSVTVHEGERVTAGQPLGLCGDSGAAPFPHVHFHMQTTAQLANGEGLPAQFASYLADGKPVERGEPVKNQVVENR